MAERALLLRAFQRRTEVDTCIQKLSQTSAKAKDRSTLVTEEAEDRSSTHDRSDWLEMPWYRSGE